MHHSYKGSLVHGSHNTEDPLSRVVRETKTKYGGTYPDIGFNTDFLCLMKPDERLPVEKLKKRRHDESTEGYKNTIVFAGKASLNLRAQNEKVEMDEKKEMSNDFSDEMRFERIVPFGSTNENVYLDYHGEDGDGGVPLGKKVKTHYEELADMRGHRKLSPETVESTSRKGKMSVSFDRT